MQSVFPQPLLSPVKKHAKPNKHTSLLQASLMRLVPLGLTIPQESTACPGPRGKVQVEAET